jgi:hypothetical protein
MMDDQVIPDILIKEPAPLVDQALAASDRKATNQEELRALRRKSPG